MGAGSISGDKGFQVLESNGRGKVGLNGETQNGGIGITHLQIVSQIGSASGNIAIITVLYYERINQLLVTMKYYDISFYNRLRTSSADKVINFAAGGRNQLFFMHERNFDTFYASTLCDYRSEPDSQNLFQCNQCATSSFSSDVQGSCIPCSKLTKSTAGLDTSEIQRMTLLC